MIPVPFFDQDDHVQQRLAGKEIIVFLDYDGTLTPIVDKPDLAVISDEMRATVQRLTENYTVSIVSGRATDDVRNKVKIEGIFYAGSHGFEINDPQGEVTVNEEVEAIRPKIDDIYRRLKEKTAHIKGALIEHVKYTVSCHYRLVPDSAFPEFEKIVTDTVAEYPELRKTSGKKVFELRPRIDWHKGKAVNWILNVLSFDPEKQIALYIGDDTTDEDAFRALNQGKGFGILVAEEPRETEAAYYVKDVDAVEQVLHALIGMKKTM
ncbi:MAG: trehalose-phosphatase [Candidatus Omnitrophota bacterium]